MKFVKPTKDTIHDFYLENATVLSEHFKDSEEWNLKSDNRLPMLKDLYSSLKSNDQLHTTMNTSIKKEQQEVVLQREETNGATEGELQEVA